MWSIIFSGFTRYFKKRKNLTFVIVGITVMLVFFLSLISTIQNNLYNYWALSIIGGDIAVSNEIRSYDIFKLSDFSKYFSYSKYYKDNRRINKYMSPRIKTGALVETKKDDLPLILYGIDFKKEIKINDIFKNIKGDFPRPDTKEIVLPEEIMVTLGIKTGDKVALYVSTKDAYPNADLFTVTGVTQETGSAAGYLVNANIGYMPIDTLSNFLTVKQGQVNEILFCNLPSYLKYFIKIPGLRYIKGTKMLSISRMITMVMGFMRLFIIIFLMIFLYITVYHNINIMNITRKKEIGVYMTFGGTKSFIEKIMIFEFIIYILFTLIFGLVVGRLFIAGFNALNIRPIDPVTEVLLATSHFVVTMGAGTIFLSIIIVIFLSISAFYVSISKYLGRIEIRTLFTK